MWYTFDWSGSGGFLAVASAGIQNHKCIHIYIYYTIYIYIHIYMLYIYIYIYIYIYNRGFSRSPRSADRRCISDTPSPPIHPVSITRFPLSRFSPGAGLLRNPFFHRSLRFSRVWVRKDGNLVMETGCISLSLSLRWFWFLGSGAQ